MKIKNRPSRSEIDLALSTAIDDLQAGRARNAARLMRDLVTYEPENFDALNILGSALVQSGRAADGVGFLTKATRLRPSAMSAWVNLGLACQVAGRFPEAITAFDSALRQQPDAVEALKRRSQLLCDLDRGEEALGPAVAFTEKYPARDEGWSTRGVIEMRLTRYDAAESSLKRALEIKPDNAQALRSLSLLHLVRGKHAAALPVIARARAANPADFDMRVAQVSAKLHLCDWAGLDSDCETILADVRNGPAHMQPPALLDLSDDPKLQRTNAEKASAKANAAAKPWTGPIEVRDRLRVGYLSGDFRDHPVCHAISDVIAVHDRNRFEIIGLAYGASDASDAGAAIRTRFDRVVELGLSSPVDIAATIREHGIDVLVDLSGPTEAGRPETLALRPAPVQVSYLGYAGTTGASFVDYVLADPVVAPTSAAGDFTEKIAALPNCYFPISNWQVATPLSRAAYGLPDTGVVFSAINAVHKITPAMFTVWTRILAAVDGSVLWIRTGSEAIEANLKRETEARGIDPRRIIPAHRVPSRADHLARFAVADLFLDTSPYGAHTTAAEAVFAGLPIITLEGRSFAARVAASLLRALQLPELVAADLAAYEQKAIELARSPTFLAALRARLADSRKSSPIFDPRRLARDIEAAFTEMHGIAASGAAPRAFTVARERG